MANEGRQEIINADFYADYYDKPWWWFRFRYDTQVNRKTILWLLDAVGVSRKNKKVLEIGFGSGVVLFSFDKSCQIAGVEVSESAVKSATARAERLGYCRADFRLVHEGALPFPDGYFDVVIASHVLEHVPNDRLLLADIYRVLNDSGAAIVLVPINERYGDPKHVRSYDKTSLSARLTKAGFATHTIIQSELLYHLVEKFYFENYKDRWGVWGKIIAVLFNVPAAMLPIAVLRMLDRMLMALGFAPRLCGAAVVKALR